MANKPVHLHTGNKGSTESTGLRRSRRHRVSPLKYWKNERIDYDHRRKSGLDKEGGLSS